MCSSDLGTVTYDNGTSGVGATLTTTGSYTTIDGYNVASAGVRILVKNEANAAWNGVYTYTNTTTITRSTDTDTYGPNSTTDLSANDYFFVTGGVVNEGSAYVCTTAGTITFGTTNITFAYSVHHKFMMLVQVFRLRAQQLVLMPHKHKLPQLVH